MKVYYSDILNEIVLMQFEHPRSYECNDAVWDLFRRFHYLPTCNEEIIKAYEFVLIGEL